MTRNFPLHAALALGLALSLAVTAHAAEAALPALKLDPARTTVSGLSSGAYMAHQLHLAHSDRIAGAALIAGGPYHCAQGSLQTALASCMMPASGKGPDVQALASYATEAAAAGRIAPLSGLAGDRVLVLHGSADQTVAASLSVATAALYRALGAKAGHKPSIEEDLGRDFTHTFPTLDSGASCTTATAPYVGKCGFDAAGEILADLYGKPPHAAKAASGELRTFDQDAFRPDGKDAFLAAEGYAYIPKACAAGQVCALHIAFHGCQQNADSVGKAFVSDAGYNRWADAYGVVVLYPQARASMVPLNPKGCWDWWGYSGEDYDSREGVQIQAVAGMAGALGAPLR
ncbi:PHB depolymerase family esterase [Dokdonella sp.]|uniref:extracellular catalytic domain type 2 short-chain-length polyhydroxyalkanoate depolymerase n=1 Tax=Dokdonella sp. TaxID=2291710 RepID=UPI0031C2BE3F|nr:hypothetical protein [Dokdonella sp.]